MVVFDRRRPTNTVISIVQYVRAHRFFSPSSILGLGLGLGLGIGLGLRLGLGLGLVLSFKPHKRPL